MSTPPPPHVPPPHPPPGPAPTTRRSPGLVALSVVLGVLLGLAVITIVLLALDGGAEAGSAESYAVATCDFVDGSPDSIDEEELTLDDPLIWQLQAIAFTATAAGHGDGEYDAYLEGGESMQRGLSTFEVDAVQDGLDALRTECEETS